VGIDPVNQGTARLAVFFDRDGVLNRAILRSGRPYPPLTVSEVEILPEANPALERLRKKGLLLIVVTNQPDVARGKQTRQAVEEINNLLLSNLPLDQVLTCFHDDSDQCDCRKPAPGLILQAAQTHHIDLRQSFMVGDRWRDIEAGQRAGCRTVFIDYGYAERQPEAPDYRVGSLAEAVEVILKASEE
jgi:D-glycero-D-manno-heptose 1,7-bisphosphate phosphatase